MLLLKLATFHSSSSAPGYFSLEDDVTLNNCSLHKMVIDYKEVGKFYM